MTQDKPTDMTAEEFFNGIFNMGWMTEEEKQAIYSAAELFAEGKVHQASLNRQGWTRVDIENIISMVCDQFGAGFAGRKEFIEKTIAEYEKKNPDPIEPCATSSENYWKQRCEAAEEVLETIPPDVNWGNLGAIKDHEETYLKWSKLKSQTIPTGDRDCEELKDIDFIVWHSGMEEYKIRNAYERYKREIEQGKP